LPGLEQKGFLQMRVTIVLAVLAAAVLAAGSAQGVTPGKSGLIYFENYDETTQSTDIFSVTSTGTGLRNVTRTEGIDETEPSASPDGKLIAFVGSTGVDQPYVLRVMNSDGTNPRVLSNASGAQQGSPTWSPSGDQITFSRCLGLDEESGDCTDAQIATIHPDNSNLRTLTTRAAGVVDSRPSWSADGKRIVFQRMNADGEVSMWTISSNARSLKRILNDESFVDRNPSFTPNSQRIVYMADVGGKEGIWVANWNGHGKKRLFTEVPDPADPEVGLGTENPSVSPTGKQFVYAAGGDLWVAAINGKNRTQITTAGGDEPDWSRG
jgi:Tol biopolymer transport system component